MFADPHHPNIVLSFHYRGFRVQVDQDSVDDHPIYAVWVDHPWGSALAIPCALTRAIAVRKAKRWVDRRLAQQQLAQSPLAQQQLAQPDPEQ